MTVLVFWSVACTALPSLPSLPCKRGTRPAIGRVLVWSYTAPYPHAGRGPCAAALSSQGQTGSRGGVAEKGERAGEGDRRQATGAGQHGAGQCARWMPATEQRRPAAACCCYPMSPAPADDFSLAKPNQTIALTLALALSRSRLSIRFARTWQPALGLVGQPLFAPSIGIRCGRGWNRQQRRSTGCSQV